ncbi:hypothetical protein [Actinotalea sp.]|uniref:hypothetical protein n=1 Tax=Actinotalea sp. TaxID=1872145 RepID=UPI00356A781B
MIQRSVVAVDRAVVLLLAVALVLSGLALLAWHAGSLPQVWPASWPPVQDQVRLDTRFLESGWWPWAIGVGGVLAVLLGLGWLLAHVPSRTVGTVVLPGGPIPGTLRIDPTPAVRTAAEQLRRNPAVRRASAAVVRERREVVARLRVTLEPSGNLHDLVTAIDQVSTDLRRVLSTDRITGRVEIEVARGTGPVERTK